MVAASLLYTPSVKWTAPGQADTTPPGQDAPPLFTFNRAQPPVRQSGSWTCSCASLAWVMNALGEPAPTPGLWDEWDAVNELRRICGFGAVSPDYGLAYASGVQLEQVYATYGYIVQREVDIDWSALALITQLGIGQIGGAKLYHWMGVRSYQQQSNTFQLANPAPSWKGIQDDLDPTEWYNWGAWNSLTIVGKNTP